MIAKPPLVSRAISALAVQFEKHLGREIRSLEITRTDVRTCDNNFAALVRRDLLPPLIDNQDLCSGHGPAYRQWRIFLQNFIINAHRSRSDGRLRRAIGIPNLRAR